MDWLEHHQKKNIGHLADDIKDLLIESTADNILWYILLYLQ